MTMGSRVPAIIRIVQVLGVLQAVGMIAASIGVIADTLSTETTQSAEQQPLTLGHLAVLLIGLTLVGGLILLSAILLPRRPAGPKLVLLVLETVVLFGGFAFIGVAAEFTAPLAVAIIVCLLLPGGWRQSADGGTVAKPSR
jgi:hypothetical protein